MSKPDKKVVTHKVTQEDIKIIVEELAKKRSIRKVCYKLMNNPLHKNWIEDIENDIYLMLLDPRWCKKKEVDSEYIDNYYRKILSLYINKDLEYYLAVIVKYTLYCRSNNLYYKYFAYYNHNTDIEGPEVKYILDNIVVNSILDGYVDSKNRRRI